jgi:hypothetical protein
MDSSLNLDRYTKVVFCRLGVFYPAVNGFAICALMQGEKAEDGISGEPHR